MLVPNRYVSFFGVSILAAGLASCSSSKIDQCNQLIDIANRAVTEVEAVTAASEPDSRNAEAFASITETAQQAASQLESIDLNDEQLQTFRQRFIRLYRDTSEATEALVSAVEAQDLPAAEAAYEKLETATGQEVPLVNEVNQYCQAT